jgi:hypothetical protein
LPVMGGTLPRLVTRSFGIQRQLVQVQAPGPAAQVPPAEPPRATANISSIRRIVAVVDLSAVICKSFRAQPTRVPGASVHDPCGTVEGLLLLARHCVDKRGFRGVGAGAARGAGRGASARADAGAVDWGGDCGVSGEAAGRQGRFGHGVGWLG